MSGAESSLVGALLIRPDKISDVATVCRPSDFRLVVERAVYDEMLRQVAAGRRPDLVSISAALAHNRDFVEAGGSAYLTRLIAETPSSTMADAYAEAVVDEAIRRAAVDAAGKLATRVSDTSISRDEIAAWLMEQAQALATPAEQLSTMSAAASALYDRAERYAETKSLPGVRTGLPTLDRLLVGGWQPGTLTLIGARPGVGKSALLLSFALSALRQGGRVLLWSGEMGTLQITARLVSRLMAERGVRCAPGLVSSGAVPQDAWTAYVQALEDVARLDGRLAINDRAAIHPDALAVDARRMALTGGCSLVLVDYLGLMSAHSRESQNVRIGEISQALKRLAMTQGVPVVAASQLSREGERMGRKPQLSDLRDSGSLEQDADAVVFLSTPADQMTASPRPVDCDVAKNREGALATMKLIFTPETATIGEAK